MAPANQLRLSFIGSQDGEAETVTCRAAKPLWRKTNRTSSPQGPIFSDTHSCISIAIAYFITRCIPGGVHTPFPRHSPLSPRRTDRFRNSFRIRTSRAFILKDFNPIRFCTSERFHLALKTKDFDSSRICTYKIPTTKPFRIRTSKKTRGEGRVSDRSPLISPKGLCPRSQSRPPGSLRPQATSCVHDSLFRHLLCVVDLNRTGWRFVQSRHRRCLRRRLQNLLTRG